MPQVFASAEAFDEWFQVGSGDKEKEAEVVEQLHKVRHVPRLCRHGPLLPGWKGEQCGGSDCTVRAEVAAGDPVAAVLCRCCGPSCCGG